MLVTFGVLGGSARCESLGRHRGVRGDPRRRRAAVHASRARDAREPRSRCGWRWAPPPSPRSSRRWSPPRSSRHRARYRNACCADSLCAPVSTGLALALLLVIPFSLLDSLFFATGRSAPFIGVAAWAGTAAVTCVFVACIARLVREAGIDWRSRTGMWALAGGILLSLAAWPVPGVVVALIVLLEAFAAGRRTLAGLAVVALLAALAHYYYALQAPLLVKAGALAATGVVLLGARLALRVAHGGAQEADRA